jgi:hypothetical protein
VRQTGVSAKNEDPLAERERDDQHRGVDAAAAALLPAEAPYEQDQSRGEARVTGEVEDVRNRRDGRLPVPHEVVQVEHHVADRERGEPGGEQVPGEAGRRLVDPGPGGSRCSRRESDPVVDQRLGEAVPGENEVHADGGKSGEEIRAGDGHSALSLPIGSAIRRPYFVSLKLRVVVALVLPAASVAVTV